jgi:HNH endonuclease
MYTFAGEEKNVLYQNLDSIREALIHLMTENQEFIDAIELSTSSVQAVTKRFDIWRLALKDVIGIATKEPRCFSRQLKESLFAANSACAICGQKIADVDDSAVDHIKQYWMGGKTIPENARLAHRFCNWSRPRKEAI